MLKEAFAGLGASRLEDAAGNPAMALVVAGIGALEVGKTAVVRLKRRVQIGRVIDGVGRSISGQQLKAPGTEGKALGEVEGKGVVPGIAIGKLRVHAVEGNGNVGTPDDETFRVASQTRQCDFARIADRERLTQRNQTREGRMSPGRPDPIGGGR